MKNLMVGAILIGIFAFGCARVRVEAPKEPIKIDVSMRLDIYQHVAKDIDEIENIVSGTDKKAAPKEKQEGSWLLYSMPNAYAQEGLGPEVEAAALARKDRRPALIGWEEKGVVGENRSGLVEIKSSGDSSAELMDLIEKENADRQVIYQAVAQKNGISVAEVEELYAKKLQDTAPAGTPIEVSNEAGQYIWTTK